MDNINDLLNSISPEDMEKLKSVAASLMNNNSNSNAQSNSQNSSQTSNSSANDITSLFTQVASQINRENDKTAFLKALRPLLSDERRGKADEAMKFLRLMDTLPLLKGLF